MGLIFVQNYGNIITTFVTIILFIELTKANQLEVAKKYGKRFGNKSKANTTDSKEIEKIISKSVVSDITKGPQISVKPFDSTEPSISRQKYSYSKLQTTTTTTTTPVPTTLATKGDEEEEVDVDLSQLQVSLPNVKFDCSSRSEGYYGDVDYRCEVFHYCGANGKRDTFLCPSNSKFNQKDMTCDTDATDDLCPITEPAWGQNHMYPTQTAPAPAVSHVSPHELNINQNSNNKEKVHIDVTAPKYETKDNGFREPVYDSKSFENQRRGNTVTKTTANTDGYIDTKTTDTSDNEGNTDDKNNNYSNNQSTDNYDNNNSKDIKLNYFGGNFGERQKNTAVDVVNPGTTNTASAVNDRKNSQNNYNNNYNINSNNDKNTHHMSTDFGTVSDANKKGYKEDNGNSRRVVTSHQPVLSHSTTDSNQYSKQSFTPNSYQSFDRLNGNKDVNSVRNSNKNSYESTRTEPYIPSTAPDKSYLSPPLPTERPSSVAPPKVYTNTRPKLYESSVHQLAPTLATRSPIKWPKKKTTDSYVTERYRETTTPPPQPITVQPRPWTPAVDNHPKKEIVYDVPMDPWPQQQNNDNYESTKYGKPSTVDQSVTNPKPIQMEHLDIQHPNWSPVSQIQNVFTPKQQNQKQAPKAPVYKDWNHLEQQSQQQQREPEQYFLNKEQTYTYPPFHHTISHSDNHLWSEDKAQLEDNYKPNKDSTSLSAQSFKPKWAQEMSEMEVIPHYQTMTAQTQPLLPQSSQPQRTENYNYKSNNGHKDMSMSVNNRPKAPKPISGRFGQSSKGFDVNDYFNMKNTPNYDIPESPIHPTLKMNSEYEGHKQIGRPQQMNFFYEQFRPYKFAENNPTEYVKKLTENEKSLLKQSLYLDENKENTKTNGKNQNILNSNTNNNNNFDSNNFKLQTTQQMMNSFKPTLIDELKYEKEMTSSKMPGYVPEILSEEDFPMSLPETHIIPKLHKTSSKPKHMSAKHNPNRYKPSKQQFVTTSNLFDELLTGENSWALKHLDTSGLETAFSHNYPVIPLQLPNRLPKAPKYPKHSYSSNYNSMITHLTPPNRLVLPQHLSPRPPPAPAHQPAFYIPQMPFAHQLQAQASMPFQYYLPFYPTPQQTFKPKKKLSKNRANQPKVIKI